MTDKQNKNCITAKYAWRKAIVIENLSKNYNGVSFEDLNNYKPCGRGHAQHPKCVDNYFKLLFADAPPPSPVYQCLCGQNIQEQCYICPIDDTRPENIIIVGNECIDKWTDQSIKGRQCDVCGSKHKNITFNLCKEHIAPKVKASKKWLELVNNLMFNRVPLKKINIRIKKKQQPCSDPVQLKRIAFNMFRSLNKHISKWCSVVSKLNIVPVVNPISKITSRNVSNNQRMEKLCFKQFKVWWGLKYCEPSKICVDLTPRLRKAILYMIDHRKNNIHVGKYKNESYQYFYEKSTAFHKNYFQRIESPDDNIQSIVEYIDNSNLLHSRGYDFYIPDKIRIFRPTRKDMPVTKCQDVPILPIRTADDIPIVEYFSNDYINKIKAEDKQRYNESLKR